MNKEMTCCNCGLVFWITNEYNSILLRDKKSFYCPNGHSQSYTGKSDAEKLQEEKEDKLRLQKYYNEEQNKNYRLEMSLRSMKGNYAKLKKKQSKGEIRK